MQRFVDKLGTRNLMIIILAAGMAIRIVAALVSRGHWFDLDLFGQWGWTLKYYRTDQYYYLAKSPDHLPGDLWFHWILTTTYHSFGGTDTWSETYLFLLRLLPSIADALMAVLAFEIVRNLISVKSGLIAAALIMLNPGIAFGSSVWGQWDSVSMVLLLAGLAIVVGRPDRWLWCVPFIAWATVTKPPLALPGMLIIAFPLLLALRDSPSITAGMKRIVPSIIGCALLGLVTIVAVCMPFSVGLPGMSTNWTIFERAQIALDMYPAKVLSAGNFWMLRQGSFDAIDDRNDSLFGFEAHSLGNLYLAISVVAIAAVFAYLVFTKMREQSFLALTWSLAAITFATFMVPTRVHERYLFPALVLIVLFILLMDLGGWGIAFVAVISGSFLANLCFVYFGFNTDDFIAEHGEGFVSFLLRTISVINVFAFLVILLLPVKWLRGESMSVPSTRPREIVSDVPARQ